MAIPVFLDRRYRRWKLFVGSVAILSTLASGIYAITFYNILHNPVHRSLPLILPTSLAREGTLAFSSEADRAEEVGSSEAMGAFYAGGEPGALSSLKRHVSQITRLMPEWLHAVNYDSRVTEEDPVERRKVVDFLLTQKKKPLLLPIVDNYDPRQAIWKATPVENIFSEPRKRRELINNLLSFVIKNHCAGIQLDFEDLSEKGHADEHSFIKELFGRFNALNLQVVQTIQAGDTRESFADLMAFTDYFYLPLTDGRWNLQGPGPVSSRQWFEESVEKTVEGNPRHWIVGVGSYGYEWEHAQSSPKLLSVADAWEIAAAHAGAIRFDKESTNLVLEYKTDTGGKNSVWFSDAASVYGQRSFLQKRGVRNVALWRLGTEDEGVWTRVPPSRMIIPYDVKYEGSGEILKLVGKPREGVRRFSYGSDGMVIGETIGRFPSSYQAKLWGATDRHAVALTFDDGPDPRYTEDIVAILEHYHVPATFFIIGDSARKYPDLLRLLYEKGNEIGNHTYLHSNVGLISARQLRFEINATDSVLQSVIGHRSLLFRPPYAVDSEPSKLEHIKPLVLTSSMGYYTVDMHIDPNDWRPGKQRKQIVHDVLAAAKIHAGQVILLHDGGGDRSQTVAALPDIIEGLRKQGNELVSISHLMGVSRTQIMPPTMTNKGVLAVNATAFSLIGMAGWLLYALFVISVSLGLVRLGSTAMMAAWQARTKKKTAFNDSYQPFVAVIVPAYNEEKVIIKSVEALFGLLYPAYEVVVVDDGSTDMTFGKLVKLKQRYPALRVFSKKNAGKAEATNFGLLQTEAEIVVTVDADTIMHPKALSKIVRHFERPEVGAVAGNAKVGNRLNLLTRWQALEYIMGQNLDRRAFAMLNCICVVPGAIGAWRRGLVTALGGFPSDTLAEDTDLTLQILKHGSVICYEDEAIAFTEAPCTVPGFLRQRFRWVYGTLQAVWKHRHMFARRKFKGIGMVGLPNLLVFQILLPLVGPVMDLMLALSLAGLVWQRYQHPESYSLDSVKRIGFYYVFFFVLELVTGISAMALEKMEDWRLVLWLPLQRFFYRQLLYFAVVKSVLSAIRGDAVGWGTLKRMGTVKALPRAKPPFL
jgi:cellulose synthase/poly-beta-1,6-N-acetylglucosamine synthase-like glycosyltransferase/peptidoglycan/xylan/chitin deacetylase (PgdA/CDA1 family)/spore germination protein YaaH